jgi:uncharacterized protein YciI
MHALILMSPSGQTPTDAELQMEHERFIDALDEANKVVLGGTWEPAAAGYEAAYLVSCESPEEAHAIAASDPLVRADAIHFDVVKWQLVGMNPDAVDRSSLLYP